MLLEKIKRKVFALDDWLFEKMNGLDLGGIVPHSALTSDHASAVSHATAYYAVWCRNLRELLSEARQTGVVFENFVDLGSGKGKACFFAAKQMKFQKIIGVEFSRPIFDMARANNSRFSRPEVSFVEGDAAAFVLPDATTLVFMFNPFDEVILEKFISLNIAHFTKHQSVIAYANDAHRATLAAYGFQTVFRNQTRKTSLHQFLSTAGSV